MPPIAVPPTWRKCSPLNSEFIFVKRRHNRSVINPAMVLWWGLFLVFQPPLLSVLCIFVYSEETSRVHSRAPLGMGPCALIFCMMSWVSLIYDSVLGTYCFMCSSTNLLTRPVGWCTELHIGLPGTLFCESLVTGKTCLPYFGLGKLNDQDFFSLKKSTCLMLINVSLIFSPISFVGSFSNSL